MAQGLRREQFINGPSAAAETTAVPPVAAEGEITLPLASEGSGNVGVLAQAEPSAKAGKAVPMTVPMPSPDTSRTQARLGKYFISAAGPGFACGK